MSNSSTPEIRRGQRNKRPSLKALESLNLSKLKNSGLVANIDSDEDQHEFFYDEESGRSDDGDHEVVVEKPKLLHDNEIVLGEELFHFQTRKQRDSLAQKIAETCKTPHQVRSRLKKSIAMKMLEEGSGSEYEQSTSDSESTDEETDSDESNHEQQNPSRLRITNTRTVSGTRGKKVNNYTMKTEEYFMNNASSKVLTSNNTLDKLETPRLPQFQITELLSRVKLSKSHEKAVESLNKSNSDNFEKWLLILNENFNILLYGLGSKKNILKSFQLKLKKYPVIVVNGFFPTLSIKNIMDSIIVDLLDLKENPSNLFEACDLIEKEFNYNYDSHLYLIIHNIEGDLLRNSKAQNVLARLGSIKNIHLIASIDHINGPLIWDHNKLSRFNFVWWDVTSFASYIEETSFERSLLVQKSGHLALSSLRNVFLSLTTNSKNIYLIIVKHQLENGKNQYYQGLAFKDLYRACREGFVVSSDLALRAQLTEFVDHKMVKIKRSVDGTEYLLIPLSNPLLQKFLDEQ